MPTPVKIQGGQTSIFPGVDAAVDPLYGAMRVVPRPFDYTWPAGITLGHYSAVGNTVAGLLGANAVLAAFRWTDASRLAVPLRISVAVVGVTAVATAQRIDPITATIARNYTARDGTGATAIAFTAAKSQAMRSNMGQPILGSTGNFDVASLVAGLSGGTKQLDTNPFGMAAVVLGPGLTTLPQASPQTDLYKAEPGHGEHPLVLAQNEGFIVSWGATALATGSVYVAVMVKWAELPVF